MNSRLLAGIRVSILPPAAASVASACRALPRRNEHQPGSGGKQTRAHPARDSLASPGQGEIAQLVEHTTENRGVPGSSPGLAISSRAGFRAAGVVYPQIRLSAEWSGPV